MKYIDVDKLIAEIKRLKGQLIYGACAAQIEMETNCKDEAYNEVLSFITSLQQEQLDVDEPEYGPYARQYPKSSQEQPEVDYNKFEKLFDDFCERNKGHHITSHDACMWFWKLGLNARKEGSK